MLLVVFLLVVVVILVYYCVQYIADFKYDNSELDDPFVVRTLPDGESSALGSVASGSDFKYRGIRLADVVDKKGISEDPTEVIGLESWDKLIKEPIPIPDDEFAHLMDENILNQTTSVDRKEEFSTYLAGGGVEVDSNLKGSEASVRRRNRQSTSGNKIRKYETDGYRSR